MQVIVQRWTLKTAMVFEFLESTHDRYFTTAERDAVKEGRALASAPTVSGLKCTPQPESL